MNRLAERKYAALLLVLVVALLMQPLAGRLVELLTHPVLLAVFLVVFDRRWEKIVGLATGLPAVAINGLTYFLPPANRLMADIAFHAFIVLFLAVAIFAILRGIVENRQIRSDHVLGAVCGFLLAGIVWGNLYLVVDLLNPGSFNVQAEVAAQMKDEPRRRFLFNHLSFVTLTTLGYGDITPIAPIACALTWLEAVFGQFYVAVYVGQLVAMKLAGVNTTSRFQPDHKPGPGHET